MRSVGGFALLFFISFFFTLLQGITLNEGAILEPSENNRLISLVQDDAYQGGYGELALIDIDSVRCKMDKDCTYAMPGLDIAIGTGSKIPKSPFCVLTDNNMEKYDATSPKNYSGHCSCGPDKCVSYSVEYGKDIPFYYCGPCARLGSQCSNGMCNHEMAECREDYCQCVKSGFFYEFNYCEIPYVLYDTSLQICIMISIVVVSLIVIATLCSATGVERCWHNRRSTSSNSETSNRDTPPAYDEVMDNLPSYHDAMQMAQEENGYHENEQNIVATSSSRTDERRRDPRRRIVLENYTAFYNSTSTLSANGSNDEVSFNEEQESHMPSSSPGNDHLPSCQRYQPIELPLRRPLNI